MPWRETSPMDQRLRFIADLQREYLSLSELCRRFGVSRKTAYKWIERYEADDPIHLWVTMVGLPAALGRR